MKNLNKEHSKIYMDIVIAGDMDLMFDFAFTLGERNIIEEKLEQLKEK